jgi:hypothetical protein
MRDINASRAMVSQTSAPNDQQPAMPFSPINDITNSLKEVDIGDSPLKAPRQHIPPPYILILMET